MNSISEIVKTKRVEAKGNWRSLLIQEFVDAINEERIRNNRNPNNVHRAPVTWRQINGLLAHLKSRTDLCAFLSQCRDRNNRGQSFGKYFFGSLKVRRIIL